MEVRKFGSPKIVYSFSPTPTSVSIAGKLFIPFFFLYISLICVVPPSRTRAAHHRPVPVLLGTTGLHARRICAALAGHPFGSLTSPTSRCPALPRRLHPWPVHHLLSCAWSPEAPTPCCCLLFWPAQCLARSSIQAMYSSSFQHT